MLNTTCYPKTNPIGHRIYTNTKSIIAPLKMSHTITFRVSKIFATSVEINLDLVNYIPMPYTNFSNIDVGNDLVNRSTRLLVEQICLTSTCRLS